MTEGLHQRSTFGFSTPVNQEAEDIENYLGLTFQAKPAKIKIGLRNIPILPLHVLDGRDFLKLAGYFGMAVFERNTLGVYIPEYNAYFYKAEDPFVARHENMHAAMDQRNPAIRRLDEAILKANRESILHGNLADLPANSEIAAVYKCLQEGTAQWAAVYIGLRTGNDAERETAIKYHNKMMENKEVADRLTTSSQHARRSLKKVQETVGLIKKAFMQLDRDFPNRIQGDSHNVQFMMAATKTLMDVFPQKIIIRDASYYAGYYFTHFAMREMESKGMPTHEALVSLIDNPPTLLNHLSNPAGYAKTLIGRRN